MIAVVDDEDVPLGRIVVRIQAYGDVLSSMMIMRGVAEGRLHLRHGEFFGRQTQQRHCHDHAQQGEPESRSKNTSHQNLHYRMRSIAVSGDWYFSISTPARPA